MPKDHERNISPLQEARKKIADEKYNTLKTVLEDISEKKAPRELYDYIPITPKRKRTIKARNPRI